MKYFKFKWAFLVQAILCSQSQDMGTFDFESPLESDPERFLGKREDELLEILKSQAESIKSAVCNIISGSWGGELPGGTSTGEGEEEEPSYYSDEHPGPYENCEWATNSLEPLSDTTTKTLPELTSGLVYITSALLSKNFEVSEFRERIDSFMRIILKKSIDEAKTEDDPNVKAIESSQAEALQAIGQIESMSSSISEIYI
ncbi:hypothetical protein EROM_111930 [Encephalitozoon romaleae SJ-2008]|uniref:Spore wall protein n=1 Tax=Encephalitozoon romaleae (strain SJ-2008) TaxID=1178016 RepID=I7AQN3_ENCRO|nr:hypothetical protein EROM_111930 [Encephalitozoon romaleae SJ-2008]AFN84174.1 hypothetical protein EROM_111930 [Encephalitozoon romaleae SJ-2008]